MRTIKGITSSATMVSGVELSNRINDLERALEAANAKADFYRHMWEMADDDRIKLERERAEDLYIESNYGGMTSYAWNARGRM